jgi:ferredoxin
MPRIRIANTGQSVDADLVTSILVTLQRNDVGIMTSCGGKARCGKCLIRVVQGAENLSKKTPAESARLASFGSGPGAASSKELRLACQTYVKGDVEVAIVNFTRR